MMKAKVIVAVAAILLLAGGMAQAVGAVHADITIDTVRVGNAGNRGDMRYNLSERPGGYGSVAYEYNIGKYEVTAGQYTAFLNAVAGVDTYSLYNVEMAGTSYGSGISRSGGGTVSDRYRYAVVSEYVDRPVNYVCWGDAARFANWLHNGQQTGGQDLATTEDGAYYLNGATNDAALLAVSREADWKWAITSEDEWYKAAYYNPSTSTYFNYPTSSNLRPGRDTEDASGNNANYYGDPWPILWYNYTTVVGEFQNSESPYGTFDQGGNVWEMNEAVLNGSSRGLRGGAFDYYTSVLVASNRGECSPTIERYSHGFRVSEVPEPATLSLLALGGLAVLRRRR